MKTTNKTCRIKERDGQQAVQRMIHLGRYHAVREGVPTADVDDCQMTFVERMLQRASVRTDVPDSGMSDAWLHRCAQNHARNYRRSVMRREGRCVSLTTLREQATQVNELVDPESPEHLLIRKHLQRSIDGVVGKLVPEVRSMLLSHYVLGQTAAEIATQCGRSPHAVEQALYRARIAMRQQLSREGVSATDSWLEAR